MYCWWSSNKHYSSVMLEREEERTPLLGGGTPCLNPEEENVQSHPPRPWLLGSLLAVLSGILFTANNFLVKYFSIEAVEMLLVRSSLQTVLMAVVIGNIGRTRSRPEFRFNISVTTRRSFVPCRRLDRLERTAIAAVWLSRICVLICEAISPNVQTPNIRHLC